MSPDTNQTETFAYHTIDEYIARFPTEVQEILNQLRKVIRAAAPDASEKFSWQMPTFFLYGNLVHFAAYSGHIGFYPTPSGISAFADRLSGYKFSKGTIQFPLSKPIPYDLIDEIVRFRVMENTTIAKAKKK